MQECDVRAVVRAVLDEERQRHADTMDDVVLKAVATILTSFGIDDADRKEMQADFSHLRKWRKSVEQAQSLTFKVAITAIITGILGACWLGLKAMIGR